MIIDRQLIVELSYFYQLSLLRPQEEVVEQALGQCS